MTPVLILPHAAPQVGAVTHLKITIYPDGGVMRLRALGFPSPDGNSKL
jgi:allantoicase